MAETVNFHLAGLDYGITGVPGAWWSELPERLANCRTEPPADDALAGSLHFDPGATSADYVPPAEGHDLHSTTRMEFRPGALTYQSDWCRGELVFSPGPEMRVTCHRDARPWFGGLLENVLRITVAYDLLHRGGLLLHAAGIVVDGNARVLFGHSGAGKSTTSEFAQAAGYPVLSDDIVALVPGDDGWALRPVPFCGTFRGAQATLEAVPLGGLYHLHQSDTNRVAPYSPATGVAMISASAPFVNQDPFRSERLLDAASRLVGAVPVQRLYFTREARFLGLLED
ncbi:MAG: hypothetical protein HKN58_00915 [Xanthomonadales bacterium]|nr:hypothetical protein [Xanthomonadales bacterium]